MIYIPKTRIVSQVEMSMLESDKSPPSLKNNRLACFCVNITSSGWNLYLVVSVATANNAKEKFIIMV